MSARPVPNPEVAAITAPAPLRDLAAWVVWKRVWDPEARGGAGAWRKVPFWANGGKRFGQHGRPEDRRQLVTFEFAKAAALRRGFDGVGFATLKEWGICAVDFDDCVVDGRVRADVLQACEGTYAEVSPSGQGVRAFVRGDFGNRKDHDYGIEVFSTAGFVTVTGKALPIVAIQGDQDTIADAAPALRSLVAKSFGREEPGDAGDAAAPPLGLTDAQIRECIDVLDPSMRHEPWLRVGMALHHETAGEGFDIWDEWSSKGASYPGSAALRARWDSFGRGGQRPVTANWLVRTANENGAHVDLAALALADFDVIEASPAAAAPAKPGRFTPVPDVEFMDRPAPAWIVKGLVPQAELLVLFGESGAGKSFVAVDLFAAVSRGEPWRGLRVPHARRVVYVCAEGAGGFRNRLQAYAQHRGGAPGFKVIANAPNLLLRDDALEVGRAIAAAGGADVVVIDTFAQTTPGANENAAEDMGKALGHCKGISRQLGGALVVLVHHAGKDASKGARGWSGLKAAADAEIEVIRTAAGRVMRASKQKDGEDGQEWGFELAQVALKDPDADGDVVTSCVVNEAPVPAGGSTRGLPNRRLGKWEQHVVDALNEISVAQNSGIEVKAVLDLAVSKEPAAEGRDTRRQHASRALKRLVSEPDAPWFMDEDGSTLSVG